LNLAHDNYLKFRNLSLQDRLKLIKLLAAELKINKEKLSSLITIEMGKPIIQSRAEIDKSISLCNYYVQHAENQLSPIEIKENDLNARVFYQPLGVILGIMPWNFPVWQTLRFCIPAIIVGNVVILKPASNVPQCSLLLQDIFIKVFSSLKVFQLLFIATDQVSCIIKDPLIAGVSITGSAKAGSSVASLAGENIKKSVLELGGSDPFVVCKDADLKKAAQLAIKSRMNNSGQTCIAAKRILVDHEVYEEFTKLLKAKMEILVLGDPIHETTHIGPLARKDLRGNLEKQMEESIKLGANSIIKGGTKSGKGNYFSPCLIDNISKEMPLYKEEIFGPIGVVIPFNTIEEAVVISNDTEYGLGAAIWTNDKDISEYYSSQVDAGYVAINNLVSSDPRMPFGGIKKSGYGRELGAEGLKEFTNIKTVNYH
ncbi:MAG TPA: NAD-dependent succinate-semialdehyde dehydrogenase, partial [Saprospiraceae bacterium]|nr:NAD-dependent succinate-semialdehyde dehydrogenase [Saprospiraceae bacterium]